MDGLFAALARVKTEQAGAVDDEELARRLAAESQVLCVVDLRAQAADLHDLLRRLCPEGTFHLSAAMCPAHRRAMLDTVRMRLKDKLPCRLVATTVIEAGVDVDFPVVWRAAAGLDSLAQAAGRCNRNGSPRKLGLRDLELRRGLAKPLLARFADPLCREAVQAYFATLFSVQRTELDRENILDRLEEGAATLTFPFRGIAQEFRLIDQETIAVIVPWQGVAAPLITQLETGSPTILTLRALQQVTVAVYPGQVKALEAAGALRSVGPDGRFRVLVTDGFYDDAVGLRGNDAG